MNLQASSVLSRTAGDQVGQGISTTILGASVPAVLILIASDMPCAGMKDAFKADLLPEICRKDVSE